MANIINPVLKGFHPDPAILRVEDDYYIATSTFEWFPGVEIHHSRDLVHWRLLTRPLTDSKLLDMRGNPSSGGVWAPCLSYDNGTFYLLYTDVKSYAGIFKDTPNYLTTAESIHGPWSDPIYLNSSGFDPSLFHDDDGRKWVLNMVWDHRKGRHPFYGIVMQEFDQKLGRLVGSKKLIFKGTSLGCTEGPHLYKREGWYYLMTAEGGTGYEHAVTMARSRSLFGPYEVDPTNPILTSSGRTDLELQKAGHASLVETQTGEWYLAHLCARPIQSMNRSPLGRETALQRCCWTEDGWLRVESPDGSPQLRVRGPELPLQPWESAPHRDAFNSTDLGLHWQSLRTPIDSGWLQCPGPHGLRLYGRESLNSMHDQSLIARRLDSLTSVAQTALVFLPESFQQMAGLIFYYNNKHYYYLRLTWDEELGPCLGILTCDDGMSDEPLPRGIPIASGNICRLRGQVDGSSLQFSYSMNEQDWTNVGPVLDLSKLSDEYCTKENAGLFTDWGFTGAFVGLCVQDLSGERMPADFLYFEYHV